MQATMHNAFITEWRNYLVDLGLVFSWDADYETKEEIIKQAELTQESIAQQIQSESTLSLANITRSL